MPRVRFSTLNFQDHRGGGVAVRLLLLVAALLAVLGVGGQSWEADVSLPVAERLAARAQQPVGVELRADEKDEAV